MVETPEIKATQSYVQAITASDTPETQVAQAFVNAVVNFPTEEVQASQTFVNAVTADDTAHLYVSQGYVTVVCKGRIDDPKIRVWTYTLDGHDYYILRLGSEETLVYDTNTGEWFTWGSFSSDYWKAFQGINWRGADYLSPEYGSDIVVGDDSNGTLYFLNPEQYQDDDAVLGSESPRNFTRTIQGQALKRGYGSRRMYGLELLGSIGKMDVADLTDVTLSISKDRGETYTNMGTVSITNDDFDKRVNWRSLGSFSAPGVLFKIEDEGALVRIDNLTLYDDEIE